MFLTLVMFLLRTKKAFGALGVDIMVQEQVALMLQHMDKSQDQQVKLVEANSLDVLPKLVEQNSKFDLVLLDGDHNYYTVAKELTYLNEITHPHSIVIIDDYSGRWAHKDLFYADRPGYENVTVATPRVDTDKHGVQPAVDEWLSSNVEWKKSVPVQGEPVMLVRDR